MRNIMKVGRNKSKFKPTKILKERAILVFQETDVWKQGGQAGQ